MPVELVVPSVGESINEVQIAKWLKEPGEAVAKDEGIVELETDKATLELPAPVAGTVTKFLKKVGESAGIGEVIGIMEEGAAPTAKPEKAAEPAKKEEETRVMPAAQRALAEKGLTPADVQATGPGGRLLKEDVLREPSPTKGPIATPNGREEEIIPMTPLRKRVAERLVQAQQTAAMLTTFNEIDMSEVQRLRAEFKDAFEKKYGTRLGMMAFFVKATIDALKQFPALNAEIRGTDIVYKNYYDIGIAVQSAKGLVVPVLRDADRMSFAETERTIHDFGTRAKENKIELRELEGGTFSITNGGVFGSLFATPIINPPQSGILGMHGINDRPVARDGQVVIRPMMYVALTYDHRIVDGRESVTFLRRIKDAVENPTRMLLEI